jgi:hypothetical protein
LSSSYYTNKIKRKVRWVHWYMAGKEKTNNTKVIKVKCIAFLISLIILSDLWTIQFRLSFKGHKSLEYCCLVIHLTSVSIISFAESDGGIFVLIGRIKPDSENVKDYFERLVFQRPQIARIEVNFEINFPSVNTTFHADSNSGIFVLVWRIKPEIKPGKQSIMRVHD